jgi:hypothetical protein
MLDSFRGMSSIMDHPIFGASQIERRLRQRPQNETTGATRHLARDQAQVPRSSQGASRSFRPSDHPSMQRRQESARNLPRFDPSPVDGRDGTLPEILHNVSLEDSDNDSHSDSEWDIVGCHEPFLSESPSRQLGQPQEARIDRATARRTCHSPGKDHAGGASVGDDNVEGVFDYVAIFGHLPVETYRFEQEYSQLAPLIRLIHNIPSSLRTTFLSRMVRGEVQIDYAEVASSAEAFVRQVLEAQVRAQDGARDLAAFVQHNSRDWATQLADLLRDTGTTLRSLDHDFTVVCRQ